MDLVTGSTGFIGNVLVRRLIDSGRKVRAFLRTSSDKTVLEGLPVERITGNILDPHSLTEAFRGVDTVYHMAAKITIMPWEDRLIRNINLEGTRNILKACFDGRVKKLIYTSTIHALKEPPIGTTIDENMPYDPNNERGEYDRSKAQASLEVMEAAGKGLHTVVLCPTGVLGPYDWRLSPITQTFLDYYNGKMKMTLCGAYDFVDVRDVAEGHILASQKAKPGSNYILSGQRITMQEMFGMLEEITGTRAPWLSIPTWLVRAYSTFMPVYYKLTGKTPRFTNYSIKTLNSNSYISHKKATEELGYDPRPIKKSIEDTIKWFKEAKIIT
jgi:dihydroflavonol-4-reductase